MQKDAILIVSEEFDTHTDHMIEHLTKRNERIVRFHPADFPLEDILTYSYGNARFEGILRLPKRTLNLQEVKSVWVRRPTAHRFDPTLREDDLYFARRESHHALRALWGFLDCLWVNHPLEDGKPRYKLLQLQVANEVGLRTPRSLVTTEPEAVKQFYEECHGKMIHKVLAWPYIADDGPGTPVNRMIYTNMVDLNKVDISRVKYCPCLFQEYVEKDVELRVTVVGERVFACEIHSQQSANPRTQIDWRNYSLHDTPHVAVTLPAPVEEACRQLVRKFDLQYSAMDLIRRPDGEYVFLENNPGGQYGWIEMLSGLPITEALGDLLVKGKEAVICEPV